MSTDLQNSTQDNNFAPTDAMQIWLDTSVRLMSTNKTQISEESGLDRTNWYKWLEKDGFEDWFFSEYQKRRRVILPD